MNGRRQLGLCSPHLRNLRAPPRPCRFTQSRAACGEKKIYKGRANDDLHALAELLRGEHKSDVAFLGLECGVNGCFFLLMADNLVALTVELTKKQWYRSLQT